MVKLVYCLRKLPHLSREEFQKYWLGTHAPLVAQYKDVLGIRRYVQVHTMPADAQRGMRARNGADEEFDGVAELWYDAGGGVGGDEAREAGRVLLEDERKFIDLARSPIWLAEEHEIIALGS